MAPRLLITVDTELSNFPRPHGISGRVGGEEWGLRRMIDVLESLGLRGTFFLDPYGGNEPDLAEQRWAAELVVARGHDLQLHTHPGPAFDPARAQLRDYSLGEQEEIIELGLSTGRIRGLYGPEGEQAALKTYRKLPRGKELAETTRDVTGALAALEGKTLEQIKVQSAGPGAYLLSVGVDGLELAIRLDRSGARLHSVGV